MAKEDKELLLKDLAARLPYGVKVYAGEDLAMTLKQIDYECFCEAWENEDFKCYSRWMLPYLRPMSSMTEEECVELSRIRPFDDEVEAWKYIKTPVPLKIADTKHFDFFHSHHLDWRGLIEKGLAIEAPEGMYKKEE